MLRRLRDPLRQAADQMARRPGLCCGALLLTGGALLTIALTCGRVKSVVAPARPPLRFFPADAPLVDLFLGQQQEVDLLRQEADVTAVFYYAPWCAHCISARTHFLQVALRLQKQVQFVAVNCWWHQGRCRKQKNLFQYPAVHVYYRRFGVVEYTGPLRWDYLESFILRVSSPLTYLPSLGALHSFLAQHQAVVGYFLFDSSPHPDAYSTYLSAALLTLKRDPLGAVQFAVVTNQAVAGGVSLREEGGVYLHRRFNSSLVFPRAQRNFSAQAVSDWVLENRESLLSWIQPITAKSYSLEAELQKGPALLTFLPHNPLLANQLLEQVSKLALRYRSCSASEAAPRCCHSLPPEVGAGVCELCVHHSLCSLTPHPAWIRLSSGPCWSFLLSYSSSGRATACCREAPAPPPDSFSGLQCRSNRTLRFLLLDAQLHATLAQRLGAGANRSGSEQPFTTIISLSEETQHVLQSGQTLESFIQNFSVPFSPLRRHLQGEKAHPQTNPLIQEVTSESFLHTVMNSQRDVLLLYYSSWCGFCSALNHVFLQLARLFQGHGALTVARVNVAGNDLPWEFMVDRLPSVLFFPRHRKQMSVKFPEDTPLTLPHLLRFVLQHCSPAPTPQEAETSMGVDPEQGAGLLQEVLSLQGAQEHLSLRFGSGVEREGEES